MNKIKGDLRILRFICLCFVIGFGLMATIGSGGGGGGGGGGDSSDDNTGDTSNELITINRPTSESSYTEYCDSVILGGEAFISPTWSRCCTGSAEDTGVTVTWENKTTGESGIASQYVDYCWVFYYYLCNHTWGATVPLTLGDNFIVVTASDPAGESGNDSITVTKPEYTYSISGNVTNMDGKALGLFVTDIDLQLSGENIEQGCKVGVSGKYAFYCIPNGSYTITPTSQMGYTFDPEYSTVVINGGDVSEINFVGDVYFISGQVKDENDSGVSDVRIGLSINDSIIFDVYTDDEGSYEIAAPNGTYIITPLNTPLTHYVFYPKNVIVVVNDEDVINVNFDAIKY